MFTILLSIHLTLCLIYHLLNYGCFPCPDFDSQHSPVTLKPQGLLHPGSFTVPHFEQEAPGSQLATTCGLQPSSFCFVFSEVTELVKKLHTINIHNLVVLNICVHSCYHQHDPDDKHTHHLPKLPCVPLGFSAFFKYSKKA